MQTSERPQLRRYVVPAQNYQDPHHVWLVDQLGLSPRPHRITVQEFHWLRLFDGRRTLQDIQVEAVRLAGGQRLPLDRFETLVRRLDDNLFLDGQRYQNLVSQRVRPPRCIGCYEGEPTALRRQLDGFFNGRGGPGKPRMPASLSSERGEELRAVLVPHVDYPRGGTSYAWGFKEVFERTAASLFVIIGTSHYSTHRFTLTRKDFATPLGVVTTDQEYIDRLVGHYGDGLFDDELMAHLPEHSIELELVFLQYLYEGVPDIRIVPLVVGSFQDCVDGNVMPTARADIARMVQALRRAEAKTREPICYLVSGDLAHLGPKFGDRHPVAEALLSDSRKRDQTLLREAESADPARFFHAIAREGDARRICGLPPLFTVLEAIRPRRGQLLHYDQYVHPRGLESVSFASMAFYG